MEDSTSRMNPEYLQTESSNEMQGVPETPWVSGLSSFEKTKSASKHPGDWTSSSAYPKAIASNILPINPNADPRDGHFVTPLKPSFPDKIHPPWSVPDLKPSESRSLRALRLSKSPLDHLQAEFKKYSNVRSQWNLESSKQDEPEEHGNTSSDTQDWSFVKRRVELPEHASNYDCPSMTTGSTLSSRNSSTRSTKSNKWDGIEQPEKQMCPIPECGRKMKDLAAHLLTHQAERPEKCPIHACEYYIKGFARPHDKVRHTLTHFNESFVCEFCRDSTATDERRFSRCDVFLRHLVNAHGVEQVPPGRRDELYKSKANTQTQNHIDGQPIATCKLCIEPFDAQGYYEHLRGCVLRQVIRNRHSISESYKANSTETEKKRESLLKIAPEKQDFYSMHLHKHEKRADDPTPLLDQSQTNSQDFEIEEITTGSRCLSLASSHGDEDVSRSSSDEESDWSEDTGSPDSTPDTEDFKPILSPVKMQLVNAVMAEFHKMFGKEVRSHHCGAATSGAGSSREPCGSSTRSAASFASRKRSLSDGNSPPNDEGDDPRKRKKSDPKRPGTKSPDSPLRFACPYYKRNPGRHQTFTSCRDPGFKNVARLKEHLYRRHQLPIQCNRCCATFGNESTLREHQRDIRGCEVTQNLPLEGFDKDQENQLKSKKRSPNSATGSEEDRWRAVYRILFPDDDEADVPSPYVEYQPYIWGESSNFAQYQEFFRLELPRLVRRTLEVVVEEEAQPLEEKLKERLVDIVRDCQTELISVYRTTQMGPMETSELMPALLPDEQASTEPQPPNNENKTEGLNPSFNNFDSFDLAVASSEFMTIPATRDVDSTPPVLYRRPGTQEPPAIGSPDSGYSDTTWTSANQMSHMHHQLQRHRYELLRAGQPYPIAPAFNTAPVYTNAPQIAGSFEPNTMQGFHETEYADMAGYGGSPETCGMRLVGRGPGPGWAVYADPAVGSSNVMMGLGRPA